MPARVRRLRLAGRLRPRRRSIVQAVEPNSDKKSHNASMPGQLFGARVHCGQLAGRGCSNMATIRLEKDGHEVLPIFGGKDSYISPN